MQKRKLKLNILDVVIVIAILCSVAVLVFNNTINEVFGKPEILPLTVSVSPEGDEDIMAVFVSGESVTLEFESTKLQAVVVSSELHENGAASVKLSLNGYKKLGRYYSENGSLILSGTACVVQVGETGFNVILGDVGFAE